MIQFLTFLLLTQALWIRRAPFFFCYMLLAAVGNISYFSQAEHWIWAAPLWALLRLPVGVEILRVILPKKWVRGTVIITLLVIAFISFIWAVEPTSAFTQVRSLRRLLQIGEAAWMLLALGIVAVHNWPSGWIRWHSLLWTSYLLNHGIVSMLGLIWNGYRGMDAQIQMASIISTVVCCVGWISLTRLRSVVLFD